MDGQDEQHGQFPDEQQCGENVADEEEQHSIAIVFGMCIRRGRALPTDQQCDLKTHEGSMGVSNHACVHLVSTSK